MQTKKKMNVRFHPVGYTEDIQELDLRLGKEIVSLQAKMTQLPDKTDV